MIKIGIEATINKLRRDMLLCPAKYFFIMIVDGQAALCIQTCDSQGENSRAHIIDALTPNSEGNLVSLIADSIQAAMLEYGFTRVQLHEGDEYNITGPLSAKISETPGLVDWIVSSVLNEDCHILIHSF